MESITAIIIAFIFLCIAYPHLIKNRPQFHAALALALILILVDCLSNFSSNLSFHRFTYFINALLQIAAILLLVMSAGGQTIGELAGDMYKTIEVVRRGGEKEEIIVPLTGEQPRSRT